MVQAIISICWLCSLFILIASLVATKVLVFLKDKFRRWFWLLFPPTRTVDELNLFFTLVLDHLPALVLHSGCTWKRLTFASILIVWTGIQGVVLLIGAIKLCFALWTLEPIETECYSVQTTTKKKLYPTRKWNLCYKHLKKVSFWLKVNGKQSNYCLVRLSFFFDEHSCSVSKNVSKCKILYEKRDWWRGSIANETIGK